VEGVAVLLGDLPAIRVATLAALATVWTAHGGARIVAPAHRGRPGHPVIFPRDRLPGLLKLGGDEGGRSLLRGSADVVWVEVDDPGVAADADLPADLSALRAEVRQGLLQHASLILGTR
jgi:molybdenum cofactor cytidylyltransferase